MRGAGVNWLWSDHTIRLQGILILVIGINALNGALHTLNDQFGIRFSDVYVIFGS